jgi:hypothetical protein
MEAMNAMKDGTKKFAAILAAAAALAVAALLAWIFSLQGTVGLFEWHPPWRLNFLLIGAAGLVPLALALVALPRLKDRSWKAGGPIAAASFAFAALGILLAAGLAAYVLASARAVASPQPALALVDPMAGVPGSGGEVRLSLSSDPHWGADTSDSWARASIIESVAAAVPKRDAFLILGDNTETGMEDSSWRQETRDLSSLLGGLPVRSLMGNHDALIDGQYHFGRYFLPAPMRSDSGSPYYYSMKAGPALIVVLNLLWSDESFDRAQAEWLERRLSSVPEGEQVIVLSHAYFYASGYVDEYGNKWYDMPGTIATVSPILERHKVALVVSGHNHYMELLRHGGVTYAVIGAMGGILDPEPTYRSPASVWFKAGTFGYLDLDISAAGIQLAFRGKDGSFLHEDIIPARR